LAGVSTNWLKRLQILKILQFLDQIDTETNQWIISTTGPSDLLLLVTQGIILKQKPMNLIKEISKAQINYKVP
jgi:hypothetical protein